MRKYQMTLWIIIASSILLTGFKQNIGEVDLSSRKAPDTDSHPGPLAEAVKISIADAIVVQGNKGQKTVEVMVLLSRPSSEPVTVKYNTKDGTAKAGVDYIATSGSIKFEPGEISRRIDVSIIGEVAADPDEDAPMQGDIEFWVNLNGAIAAIIDKSDAIITILKNLAKDPRLNKAKSVYEVAFVYNGYLSLYAATAQECGANPSGIVVLSGLLEGVEDVDPYDDISYTGTLQMIMGIDVCSVTRTADGQDKHCALRVSGSGTVDAELEIYFGSDSSGKFDGRGGYMKIQNKDGRFMRTVAGDCDAQQIDDEWVGVPNKSIASVFNGYELPMLRSRTLVPGVYSVTDSQGNKTTVNVVRKIR
jgi:hypothetical protein